MLQIRFTEKIKTHFTFKNFYSPEIRARFEVMWKNMIESDRPQITTRRVRLTRGITQVTRSEFM
jgi:hypothetical protein